jgi:exodeoxyribonuclease-5
MIGGRVRDDLLSFGVPALFVGDHGQLPPVGGRSNLMADPMHRLETLHRNAGPIARFAEHLRRGGSARRFDGGDAVRMVDRDDLGIGLVLGVDQAITAFNRTRVRVNVAARRALGRDPVLVPGDRIICLRNDRRRGIFNGMQGTAAAVYRIGGRPHLHFLTASGLLGPLPYDPEQFGRVATAEYRRGGPCLFDHAYCVTAHKAQGDEWGSVLVIEQECDAWEHPRWAYTAASRARHRLIWSPSRPIRSRPTLAMAVTP